MSSLIKHWVKRTLFPGLDIHLHQRTRLLSRFFRSGDIATLDAGCGNGALALAAYRLGNRTLGVTLDEDQIRRNREFFRNCDPQRMQFEVCNLYDLPKMQKKFDQIICFETLEHISRDTDMVALFYSLLNPGGVLHLCCPYALHPE